jgi:hypothetical protein
VQYVLILRWRSAFERLVAAARNLDQGAPANALPPSRAAPKSGSPLDRAVPLPQRNQDFSQIVPVIAAF